MCRNIKRVVFQTMTKFNGIDREPISASQAKQIAGRAGRFGTSHEAGLATTLMKKDLTYLQQCMTVSNESIAAAGLLPSSDHVVNMASAFPRINLPSIIDIYRSETEVGSDWSLTRGSQ
jgi:ATP-dependent RNA helicase SUPV3L1/SUV3